ncbi:hypothetical protein DWZ29_10970 [Anaerobutyricum hallii]|uniref:Uncharacterized protein n=1 Tax=Anaerobutyricum hallii TaxID=39488 RepID=A0A415U1G1_9FIRM|nr:hypothetical protein DWZ29_10970 [Anaerobutyricum hallii]
MNSLLNIPVVMISLKMMMTKNQCLQSLIYMQTILNWGLKQSTIHQIDTVISIKSFIINTRPATESAGERRKI